MANERDKREPRRAAMTLICYMDNDSINSEVGKDEMSEYAEQGHKILYRNPAFYAVSDDNGTLKGEVERIGMKNAKPDGVIIRRGSTNEQVIERSYRAAGVPVEFVKFEVPRPKGTIEPQPGGELLQFLRGMAAQNSAGSGDEKSGEPAASTGKEKAK